MGFSRQEHWSAISQLDSQPNIGLPFPFPGDLPNLGAEPASLASRTLAGRFFTTLPQILYHPSGLVYSQYKTLNWLQTLQLLLQRLMNDLFGMEENKLRNHNFKADIF